MLEKMTWERRPESYKIDGGRLEVVTSPHTDLWQRTYYHFRNDNAPVFQMETDEKFFSFIVKCGFAESRRRFDQCGIVIYLDSENWLKASVEYENESFRHLGSVVTNHGYSDWATTAVPASVNTMWYRLRCGTVFHAGRTITASSAHTTEKSSRRCEYAIFGRAAERYASACMRAVRRIRASERFSQILQ